MSAPNFAAVLTALADIREERLQDIQDAECELAIADRRLAYADLAKDRRLWTEDERTEYRAALIEFTEAQQKLADARAAL